MLTTLFCDASWCPDRKVGAWGIWYRNSRMERGAMLSSFFRDHVGSSDEAELKAIAVGLHCVSKSGTLEAGDLVLIQSDSMSALNVIKSGRFNATMAVINEIRQRHELTLRVKHVPGHQPSAASTRYGVNNRCDEMAKEQLRIARELHDRGEFPLPASVSRDPMVSPGAPGR